MELTASDLWYRILDAARDALPETSYTTWLSQTAPVALSESELVVEAQSAFHADWIEDKFGRILTDVARRVLGRPLHVTFRAGAGMMSPPPDVSFDPTPAAFQTPAASATSQPVHAHPHSAPRGSVALNERYTFERFVVGNNNQLAAAACHGVAENPGRVYNPLFLYGGVGLGKTHLMHAIGHRIFQLAPNSRMMYVTSEQFTNDLVTSIQEGSTAEFRRRYRQMDLLLVDDVHFLEGKERTQEEFFHTFNTLYDAQKQIVLTSDRPPKEISGLEDRLISRFEWGLVADIKPPDFETRFAILRKKAEDDRLTIDDEILSFIARSCNSSVRELEGAIIKLLAYSSLKNQELSVSLAREALAGILRDESKAPRVTPEHIRDLVARRWSVRSEALSSKRRTKDLTVPRQVAMYLIKETLGVPLVQIGTLFGGRDHSTVIHSIRKVEEDMQEDEHFKNEVDAVRTELKRTVAGDLHR
jgi:chromosomal replication initiator protein